MRLAVDYATTADMADGQPLPPFIDDDDAVWRIVRRLPDARTCWCRIRFTEQTTKQITKRQRGSATGHDQKIHAQDRTETKET
jgi:hypothetical protein